MQATTHGHGTLGEHSCECLEPSATDNHTLCCDGSPRSLMLKDSDFEADLIDQPRLQDRGLMCLFEKNGGSIRHQWNSGVLAMFHQVSGLYSRPEV